MEVPSHQVSFPPAKKKHGRKFLLWLVFAVGLVILVILVWYVKWYKVMPQPVTENKNNTESRARITLGVKRTEVDVGSIPDGMPPDIPQEIGSRITQNYIAISDSGDKQAVREYETTRKLEENTKTFKDYILGHAWTLTAEIVPAPGIVMLGAVKNGGYLTVTIGENSVTKRQTVKILITQLVKNK